MKRKITKETKDKIIILLDMGITYLENVIESHEDCFDMLFITNAYSNKFNELYDLFKYRNEVDDEKFDKDMFSFESALFVWTETLTHNLPDNDITKNSIYDVLYGVLTGISNLLEQDLINQQDNEIDEDTDEDTDEEILVERSFPD